MSQKFVPASLELPPRSFDEIKISLASPKQINSWSYGEVKKPETINYRTFKPERDGLFCARIFGPVKDYECLCGKYRRMKFKGIICEKCNVEVTFAKTRRERMGHIELAAPVVHVWFLKSLPSRIGLVLDRPLKLLEQILYFEKFVVTDPGVSDYSRFDTMTDREYYLSQAGPDAGKFKAQTGAEAIKTMLGAIELDTEIKTVVKEMDTTKSQTKKKKLIKRLKILEGFKESRTRPEWMVLTTLPVLPPDLRPLVPLESGRFATSDLNDLYRRVINRNNRLKRLIELHAPDIILNNEKRILQEAVDVLFDNGRRGRVATGANRRPLKSLSDMLKGKQGRFRQNLLGKRVDYSGRSVIVVGPTLNLHQCGIPKKMALELFKPFVIAKLQLYGKSATVKAAKRMIESEKPEVWDLLAEVINEHPVLLNRAPTLHRLGIQAFEPILVDSKAIQLHPLVCAAFNADFDGDQMAVHVPLSMEAQLEARVLMMSTNNILSPANGKPIIVPSQDIVLGLYYLTMVNTRPSGGRVSLESREALERFLAKGDVSVYGTPGGGTSGAASSEEKDTGETNAGTNGVGTHSGPEESGLFYDKGADPAHVWELLQTGKAHAYRVPVFATLGEIEYALQVGSVRLHDKINTFFRSIDTQGARTRTRVQTTPGRMIFASILPPHPNIPFSVVNKLMIKKEVSNIIDIVYRHCGQKATVIFCDDLMRLGFKWACKAGISIGKDDMLVPEKKKEHVAAAQKQVQEFESQFQQGLLTGSEKYNRIIDTWSSCTDLVANEMMDSIKRGTGDQVNSIYMMAHSGARGSEAQIKQLAGMRGLMTKPSGEIIERPIISNFKEGLSVQEYFTSTHGARKGLADTALKTASSGYLTRKLVDVAQDCVITVHDCGTEGGLPIHGTIEGEEMVESLSERILGRVLAEDIIDPQSGEVLFKRNDLVDEECAGRISTISLDSVKVRSILTCEAEVGVCALCYGRDLARGKLVNIGEAVGVIAAQSIGEPGTQLTMRTFHIGGAIQGTAEQSSVEAALDGIVQISYTQGLEDREGNLVILDRSSNLVLKDMQGQERARHRLPYGARVSVRDGEKIASGQKLAEWNPYWTPIIATQEGIAHYVDLTKGVSMREDYDDTTGILNRIVVDAGDAGQKLKPRITLRNEAGEVLVLESGLEARHFMPVNAQLVVNDQQRVAQGDILARIPRQASRAKDITGGLPRVAELFEARKATDQAFISEIDGRVIFGKDFKNKRRIVVEPPNQEEEGQEKEYHIPKSRHLVVNEGDFVRRGEALTDGNPLPQDILEIMGIETFASYLCAEIQHVYRLQGVKINDKHIEVIMRRMLGKVEIVEAGDTFLVEGEQIDKEELKQINETMLEKGRKPATAKSILLGITKASLGTKSFISAASFQETTRILTEAAVGGRSDKLQGLKENVIVGRLVPAGTGSVVMRTRLAAMQRDKELQRAKELALQAQQAQQERQALQAQQAEQAEQAPLVAVSSEHAEDTVSEFSQEQTSPQRHETTAPAEQPVAPPELPVEPAEQPAEQSAGQSIEPVSVSGREDA